MSIMSRILRLWKADLHGVMDQLEDKSLLLKQCLREMETGLQQKQSRLAQLRRACEQLGADQTARVKELTKIEEDIELAVRKEKDDIAKMLIRKRMTLQAESGHLANQQQQLEEDAQRLGSVLVDQQNRYERLKIQTAAYCRQVEQNIADPTDPFGDAFGGAAGVTDQEVELELMRRKEAAAQGGAR